jgi:hypothetical protein
MSKLPPNYVLESLSRLTQQGYLTLTFHLVSTKINDDGPRTFDFEIALQPNQAPEQIYLYIVTALQELTRYSTN